MPAASPEQAHTARMALAHKHGKPLADFPEGARSAIRSMAEMSEEQLREFVHTRRRRSGSVLTGRK